MHLVVANRSSLDNADSPSIGSHISVPINSLSPTPSYTFMATLSVFVAAILTNFANTKMLNGRGALYTLRKSDKPQKGIAVPSVYARLSQLLQSKNADSRTREPWAKDVVRITFQGLEALQTSTAPDPQGETAQPATSEGDTQARTEPGATTRQKALPSEDVAVVVTEARMSVPLPKSMININEQVERDIAFHAESGAFAFRLRTRVGETIVPALIERVTRVERLVDYVQILQSYAPQLSCDSVSLGMISFSYSSQSSTSQSATNEVSQRYRARIDFGNVDRISLLLSQDDPHLRILDLLNQILNSPQGFRGVAKLLPVTVPALHGLNELQNTWSGLSELGECFVIIRAAEWYVIRYTVGKEELQSRRQFNFSLRLQDRKGEAYWHLQRTDTFDREGDDLEVELRKIWNSVNKEWLGMRLSGVARPAGIGALLQAADGAVRAVASNPAPAVAPATSSIDPSQAQAQLVAAAKQGQRLPTSNQQQQQRPQANAKQPVNGQQRPPPNQGKTNVPQREVVILD